MGNTVMYKAQLNNIPLSTLDIIKTFECGQCFRWKLVGHQPGEYVEYSGIVGNHYYKVRQTYINNKATTNIEIESTDENAEKSLYDYFDLGTDYSTGLIIPDTDEFAKDSFEFGKGIRILKQDAWESLISFIISQRNNIPKIKSTIEKMCKVYGEKIEGDQEDNTKSSIILGYTFPSIEKLSETSILDLTVLGLGYRDEYVNEVAQDIRYNSYKLNGLKNKRIPSYTVISRLKEFRGVGDKVANCVALFGLNRLDTFPIDVWMQRVIDRYYQGNLNEASFGKYRGLMQQYMFFNIKYNRNLK